ncbi:phosphoglycerate mutase-like protein [Marasmius fiardii PR-910]|nr:phosphoglycerate mutase-like protein [Marasmius fiardii PR-910]
MPSARLYIVRHGETNENRAGIIQGHRDTQLNALGLSQALVVADALEKTPFTEAWSSDLQRAVKTAQIIIEKHPRLEIYATKALRERRLGALEGTHVSEKSKTLEAFPGGVDPSAEGVESMQKRLMSWWDTEVLALTTKPVSSPRATPLANGNLNGNGVTDVQFNFVSASESSLGSSDVHHVLIVSHGGFIGSLVKNLLATNRVKPLGTAPVRGSDWMCHNTSITTIDVSEDGKGTLIKYADISHMLEAVRQGKVTTRNADVSQEGMDGVSGRN